MKLQAFSVFDSKSGAFGVPFFAYSAPVAQRNIAAVLRDGDSLLAKFPEDYQLFQIGEFDDSVGSLDPCPPVAVCNVVSLREKVHAS